MRRASSTTLLLLLVASGPTVFGQQAAAQQTAAQKTTEVKAVPADEGRFKAIIRRLSGMGSSDEKEKEGVTVDAGIIIAGSSLSGGVGYRRPRLFGNIGTEVEANLSLRMYQDYRAAIGWIEHRGSTLEFDVADDKVSSLFNPTARKSPGSALFADIRYRDYPRHTYYGTGIESIADDKSDYALRGASVEGVWQWQMSPTLGLSARSGWLGLDVDSGHNDALVDFEDRFVPSTVPGAPDQPHFFTYGLGVVRDTRSEPGAPEDGEMIGVGFRRFSASDVPALSFTRVNFDVRGYRRLLSPRGVLAVRGLVSTDLTGDTAATPFYLQQSLGGGETLRGFHSYRFADQSLAHVSVEYRWRAHRYVEIAPFVDAGTVASSLSNLSLSSVKMSPGVGIRGRTSRRVIGRLDWAWGSEGQRIAIGMSPVF